MPLVVITGIPSSGKSTVAKELKEFLEVRKQRLTHLIREEDLLAASSSPSFKDVTFGDSAKEKEVRAAFKSSVIRLLSRDVVVVADGLNYIKGFRYELWCASKAAKTTQCTVHCDVDRDLAWTWNRDRPTGSYGQEVFDGLVARYEAPNPDNRWDSPLILALAVRPEPGGGDDSLGDKVHAALFDRAPLPPNLSTQNRPLSQPEFLYRVDRGVAHIEDAVLEAQRTAEVGDRLRVPGTADQVVWTRRVTRPELSRARKQFMVYLKMRGIEDLDKVHTMFVQYLNKSVFGQTTAEDI